MTQQPIAVVTMSLNEIKPFRPCKSGWEKLLKAQGKTQPDDVQIPLQDILASNGLADAIWCFRVKWFEHKPLFMKFIRNCESRARKHAAADAAAAAYAADAAAAAYAADAAAAAYAAYADADAAAAAYAAYAAADADAVAAAYAAYAAADADAAYAAAAADAAYASERKYQKEVLLSLLTPPTPYFYGVICHGREHLGTGTQVDPCGRVQLSEEEEFMVQYLRGNVTKWKCPRCFGEAHYDEESIFKI